ncbi:fused MFS/spermidine synthase [Burkholderia ubonensis]|uniref:Spermidine synthase n=1 Tax=Burkholderia ubonensis subsp. mesacidophila TaxID=265293 RepID=A0A2A4FDZ2_9BURK|nr:fused MFS/spermidine synthase [Burkholderia ubonensis]PCE30636.1 spermidine synthase [Burkholderia ubonensis subsp. mesacidophila]
MPPVDLPFPGMRAAHANAAADGPVIVESEHLVSLCFDGRGMQSTMLRAAPDALALGYTRTMMGFLLLLQPAPKHIGMIGLGGGSLTKYCRRHLPGAHLTVIEINPDVIALRDRFCIPPDDERLSVVCADAAQYMSTTTQTFDALLVDGFNADGVPVELASAAFYEACRARLNDDGVLVANLLHGDPQLGNALTALRDTFGPSAALAPAEDSAENLIVFAWKSDAPLPSLETLMTRADRHAGRHRVDLVEAAVRIELGASYDWTRLGACAAT